jgi:hypothetical protein
VAARSHSVRADTACSPRTRQHGNLVPAADCQSPLPEKCRHLFRMALLAAGELLPINALLFTDVTVRQFLVKFPLTTRNISTGSRQLAPSLDRGVGNACFKRLTTPCCPQRGLGFKGGSLAPTVADFVASPGLDGFAEVGTRCSVPLVLLALTRPYKTVHNLI